MNSILRCLALALAAAGLTGCRSTEPMFSRIVNEPQPLSQSERERFGVMGVLPPSVNGRFSFSRPPANVGEAITKTTGRHFTALARRVDASGEEDFKGTLSAIAFSSVLSGISGTVGGIFKGVPEADSKRAREEIQQALSDTPVEQGLVEKLQKTVADIRCTNLVNIPDESLAHLPASATNGPSVTSLAGSGFDSVVQMEVTEEAFKAQSGLNPLMAVDIRLRVAVVRVSDGAKLFETYLEYQGEQRRFVQWGANRAKLFRAELVAAQVTLAAEVCRQLAGDELFRSSK